MNCPQCKAVVNENGVLCHMCGTRLDREAPATADEPKPTAPANSRAEEPSAAEQMASGRIEGSEDGENLVEGPWRYSGKAMRGAFLLTGLVTLLLIALAVFIEVKLWAGGPHWLLLWAPVLVVAIALWLYQLVVYLYRRMTVSYSLTPYRLYHEEGLLVRRKHVIEVVDMDDMDHTQSLWERFVCGDVGTITIRGSDPGNPVLAMRGLANHDEVFQKIDDARRKQRQKRGLKAL